MNILRHMIVFESCEIVLAVSDTTIAAIGCDGKIAKDVPMRPIRNAACIIEYFEKK